MCMYSLWFVFFFFKQKTAYEMRISDWSSDVCSSDLRALRVNLAAFRTDYSDLQISQLVPLCCVVVTNAAKARIKGFEIETVVRPAAWLQLDGSYAYLDAKFTEYAIPGQDYTGNRLPRSPKNKVNVDRKSTRLNYSQ